MIIYIDSSALRGDKDAILWSGALFGLKRLQKLGYTLIFEANSLTEKQQLLLKNEHISASSASETGQKFIIKADDDQLQMYRNGDLLDTAGNWIVLSDLICFPQRKASHTRRTSETDISLELNLDGTGHSEIDTGLRFFDHMLEQIAKHGLIDVKLTCDGDLEVDEHHTIEDVAIALGEAITKALGEKMGIQRYAFALPMDESQSTVVLDLSGRPFLVFKGTFEREMIGDFPAEMVEHFFYSLAMNLKATLHITVDGKNDHHKIEACFKAFARCLRAAISRSERNLNILPSTKDLL